MPHDLDYSALFDASPYPYLLIDKQLIIIGANRAYLQAVSRTTDIIGQHVFSAFPANPADPDSTNIAQLTSSIQQAIVTRKPHNTPFVRYAMQRATTQGLVFEERYWSIVHTPVLGADEEVAYISQNAVDVTDLYLFDRDAGVAHVDTDLKPSRHSENFNRAQMHEAMKRILNDERSHLSQLFDQAPGFIAILSGRQYVFEMVNEAYYQLVGHRELLGKSLWDALPEVKGQGFEALMDQVFDSGEAVVARSIKVRVQRFANGPLTDRYIDLVYQPLYSGDGQVSGIFSQGHDVTDVYVAQQAERDADERLREGMVVARMVTWDMDLKTGSIQFSENAMAVLGAEWKSRESVWEWLHPDDAERLHAARQRAVDECSNYTECVRFIRPDTGSVMWLQIMAKVRCDAAGVPYAMRGVSLDVTERMRAEEELREADRRKDEFLAMLAHELRNPLAPISAAAQLLKMPGLKPELIIKTSEVIGRQVRHMTSLVDDLLDVSRVTRGLISLDRKRLRISEVVTDAVEQVRPLITVRRQELLISLPMDSIKLDGDQKRLVQVLTNLLNNAAKYTPEGGRLELSVTTEGAQVGVCVRDNGIGIAPELLPGVFDLFTQAERTPDRSQGGLGLGLALVRSLVVLHGGSVTADSEGCQRGSSFCVKLPRIVEVRESVGKPLLPAQTAEEPRGLCLLVVDDNADAAEMLGAFMESAGHHVMIEYEPYQAMERARANTPDVCLLDIGLPGMDGNQLARCLRRMPQMSNTTLIAVTGYGKEFDRDASIAAGFDYYFVKPADPTALVALLEKIQLH